MSSEPTFEETLGVPLSSWFIGIVGVLVCAIAFGAALGPWVALGILLLGSAGTVWALRSWTGHVTVTQAELIAGPARLPIADAGAVVALDPQRARWLRGPGADARAYLYLRSWVPTAVQVEVTDPSDPAPYWYVSTRQPEQLTQAIESARRG